MRDEPWIRNWKDYYKILQVDSSAEPEIIEAAFRRLARKYHPDVDRSPKATEKMKEINTAHDVLSDLAKRRDYHQEWLRRQHKPPYEAPKPPPPPRPTPPPPPSPANIALSDFSISPQQAELGSSVTVSVTATNRGGTAGSKTIVMLGDFTQAQTATLSPGASTIVRFSITPHKTGTFSVTVGAFIGTFSVTKRRRQPTQPVPAPTKPTRWLPASAKWVSGLLVLALVIALTTQFWPSGAPMLANSPWPMGQHDPQHTGRSSYSGPSSPEVRWSYATGGQIYSSPVIGRDGTIYVGSNDNKLYAINSDGSLKWSYTTGGWVAVVPAIAADGTVYVGSDDAKLYALNQSGSLKWSYTTSQGIRGSPNIGADGTIYVGCDVGTRPDVYAINPDGSLKWSYTAAGFINSAPAIGTDGTIYVGAGDRKLYAIDSNGSLKWTYTTGDYIEHSSPAIGADGTIYVGSDDKKLHAINPNGSLRWTYTTDGGIHSSPAIGADGTIYVGSGDSKLYAINTDGSLKWAYMTGSQIATAPAIDADGIIYVGSFDGKLYAINPNGTIKWSYVTGGVISLSSPAIGSNGTIFVGCWDNRLYAVGSRVETNTTTPITRPTSTPTHITTATPTSTVSGTPIITHVSKISAAQTQTITIYGQGFGLAGPCKNCTSPYIEIKDVTSGWSAGHDIDDIMINVTRWDDSQIVISGFNLGYGTLGSLRVGDQIQINIWNTRSGLGPAVYTVICGAP